MTHFTSKRSRNMMWLRYVRLTSRSICRISGDHRRARSFIRCTELKHTTAYSTGHITSVLYTQRQVCHSRNIQKYYSRHIYKLMILLMQSNTNKQKRHDGPGWYNYLLHYLYISTHGAMGTLLQNKNPFPAYTQIYEYA